MNLSEKLIWAEGTFLSQQHFQYWEQQLQEQHLLWQQLNMPDSWGIAELEIDDLALKQGQFVVLKCIGQFPRGELFVVEQNHKNTLSLILPHKPVTICLIGSSYGELKNLKGYENSQADSAPHVIYKTVADRYDGSRYQDLALARQHLALITEEQSVNKDNVIPIAKLNYSNNRHSLCPNFIPPVSRINGSKVATTYLLRWQRILMNKVEELSSLNLVHTVADCRELLCIMQFALLHESYHPKILYYELLRCLSRLDQSTIDSLCREYFLYQHQSLTKMFYEIDSLFRVVIESLIPTSCIKKSFINVNANYAEVTNIDKKLFAKNCYLELENAEDYEVSPDDIKRKLLLSAPHEVKERLASALPGVHLNQINHQFIGMQKSSWYFCLAQEGQAWDKVCEEGSIGIFFPDSLAQISCNLLFNEESLS